MKQCERSGSAAPPSVQLQCRDLLADTIPLYWSYADFSSRSTRGKSPESKTCQNCKLGDPAGGLPVSPPTSPPSQTKIQGALRAGDLGLVFLCPAHSLPN